MCHKERALAYVYLFSQEGCCDVVAFSDAESGVSIQGAGDVKRCLCCKDDWLMLPNDTLVMLIVVHEWTHRIKANKCKTIFFKRIVDKIIT